MYIKRPGSVCGVMDNVLRYGLGDQSSNPGRGYLHLTYSKPLSKGMILDIGGEYDSNTYLGFRFQNI